MQICGKMTDGPILRIEGVGSTKGKGRAEMKGGDVASCTFKEQK